MKTVNKTSITKGNKDSYMKSSASQEVEAKSENVSVKQDVKLDEKKSDEKPDTNPEVGYKEETKDTGVIYKITNKQNGKFYIGKAFSYQKHGKQSPSLFGAKGRFTRHYSNAHSDDPETRQECPCFYEALRTSKKSDWDVETLVITSKKHLKEYETRYIKKYKSYLPEIGYNFFIADNKPTDGEHKETYEIRKAEANRNRAADGQLKRNGKNDDLPPNISRRTSTLPNGNVIDGYFAQIKIKDKLHNKAFMSKKYSDAKKLELAKEFLAKLKQEHGLT